MRRKVFASALVPAAFGGAAAATLHRPDGIAGGVARDSHHEKGGPAPSPEIQLPVLKSKETPRYSSIPGHPGDLTVKVIAQATVDIDRDTGDFVTLSCAAVRGSVKLEGDENGACCKAFANASSAAWAEWTFAPAVQKGMPACVYLTVRFDLNPE